MTTRLTRRKEEESEKSQDGASTTARSLHRARRTANKIPTVWITRSQCQVYIFTVLFSFFKSVELQITPGNERKADAKTFAPSLADQPSVAFRPQLYPYCTSTTIENRVPTASWNPLCHIARRYPCLSPIAKNVATPTVALPVGVQKYRLIGR